MIKSIAITGSGSPIGTAFIDVIERFRQHDVHILSSNKFISSNKTANQTFADIKAPETADLFFHGFSVDSLLHLAHAPIEMFNGDSAEYKRRNLDFAIRLAEAAMNYGCKRFLFASSSAVYGDKYFGPINEEMEINPSSVYAECKAEIELALTNLTSNSGMEFSSLRIFNVYGRGLSRSFINKVVAGIKNRNLSEITFRGRDNFVRDYINVEDLANVLNGIVNSTTPIPPVINIGTGLPTSNEDLLSLIPEYLKSELKIYESEESSSVAEIEVLSSTVDIPVWSKIADQFILP